MSVIDKVPASPATGSSTPSTTRPADDGTRALLQAGFWIMLFALLSLLATKLLFGGIGIDGPHTNAGWLSFMFALMGAPFALLLLALGGAKWLRNRRLQRHQTMH